MKDVCPVCHSLCDLLKSGRLGPHFDGLDKPCVMIGEIGTWDEKNTRPAVKTRSGGYCEYCSKRRATEMHHRIGRGVGGPWCPANIIHLCSYCHLEVTTNPGWARSLGLMLRTYEEPQQEPVTRRSGVQFQPTNEVIP